MVARAADWASDAESWLSGGDQIVTLWSEVGQKSAGLVGEISGPANVPLAVWTTATVDTGAAHTPWLTRSRSTWTLMATWLFVTSPGLSGALIAVVPGPLMRLTGTTFVGVVMVAMPPVTGPRTRIVASNCVGKVRAGTGSEKNASPDGVDSVCGLPLGRSGIVRVPSGLTVVTCCTAPAGAAVVTLHTLMALRAPSAISPQASTRTRRRERTRPEPAVPDLPKRRRAGAMFIGRLFSQEILTAGSTSCSPRARGGHVQPADRRFRRSEIGWVVVLFVSFCSVKPVNCDRKSRAVP
jgi:hypothetical protein